MEQCYRNGRAATVARQPRLSLEVGAVAGRNFDPSAANQIFRIGCEASIGLGSFRSEQRRKSQGTFVGQRLLCICFQITPWNFARIRRLQRLNLPIVIAR